MKKMIRAVPICVTLFLSFAIRGEIALGQVSGQRAPSPYQVERDSVNSNGNEIAMGTAAIENCLTNSIRMSELSNYGATVAIDGDYAVATSPYYYDGPNNYKPGIAILYRREGTGWVMHLDITPPPIEGRRGALSAAISGDTIAVTGYDQTYIRRRNGNAWPVETVLEDWAWGIEGDTMIAGTSVYRRSTSWNFEADLVPTPNTPSFGSDADIDGDRAIVGARDFSQPGFPWSGSAYIFRREGGNWVQEAYLLPPQPVSHGMFGWAVSISGQYAVVGQPYYDGEMLQGKAFVYRRVDQTWELMEELTGIDGTPGDFFGGVVSVNVNRLIISGAGHGAPSATSVFELDPTQTSWVPLNRLAQPLGYQRFGNDADISGPWAIVGDYYADSVHFFAVADDCNANGKADICDLDNGIGTDIDGDQRPDSCPCLWGRPSLQDGPMAQPSIGCSGAGYAPKNRYLTFVAPETPAGAAGIALRVTMNVPGPYVCHGVPDFSASDGAQVWVGPEHMAGGMPTGVHRLQPTPHFFDWGSLDDMVLNVSDCNIVPCAVYVIEAISDLDYPGGPYSPSLTLTTVPVWADIVSQGSATLPNGIVDFSDISVLVDRFKVLPTAPPGTWCDLASASPTQGSELNIDFSDISAGVDAFRGLPYPFAGPSAPNACP